MTCCPQYTKWFDQLRHNWLPIITKFDKDLVASPWTLQPFQFSNFRPFPQPMQLLTNFSAETIILFQQSITNGRKQTAVTSSVAVLTPTTDRTRRPLLRLSPHLFHSSSTPTHSYIRFAFSIYPCDCPTLMTLLTFVHIWILNQPKSPMCTVSGLGE